MIRNYFVIALRNLRQNPLYSFINILSLAIGLASCIVIYLFISDERSFDAFHQKRSAIYRLDEVQSFTGTNVQKVALTMPGMGPNLQNEFPEVQTFTRYWNRGKQLIKNGEEQILVEDITWVDSTFLSIFDYKLLAGDRTTALHEPNSIILTEASALKFFPSIDKAFNSTVTIGENEFKITGILEGVPENSHLQFNALVSLTTVTRENPQFNDRWGSNFLNTYLVLHPGTDIKAMEEKFPAFLSRHMDDPEINNYYVLFLQALTDVHLASTDIEHDYNNYRKFNGAYLNVFSVVGIFILLIAAVNFMNLTTARASYRWKEIGVRTSSGAKKSQLFFQFIFESMILATLALVMAVILDLIFIPMLNQVIGRQLSLLSVLEPDKITGAFLFTLGLGVLAGIYPSLYMSSKKLSSMLKGGNRSEGRSVFRSSLVIVQFGLAIAMIVSTLIVVQQLDFMKNSDIGFEKDQMMLIDMNQEANEKFESLKTELGRSQYVSGVTASGQRLGNNFHQWGFRVKTDTAVIDMTPSNVNVDYDYLTVYGIKLKEGRNFSRDYATDRGMSFIINEALAKELALENPVGTRAGHGWYHPDSLGTIIAVAEDFNFNSMHHKINTLEMVVHPEWGYDEMSVKITGNNIDAAVAEVKATWEKLVPSYPFTYSFLDQHFDNLYRSDQQMSSVVTIMAVLAILISCMGLFGLAAITTERKIKEVGIRKVLGATEMQITVLLSKNFAVLILIAFLIVSPITYWLLEKWLDQFAYHITINPLLFFIGMLVALVIAIGTISYHTIRSARANPVKALRYE